MTEETTQTFTITGTSAANFVRTPGKPLVWDDPEYVDEMYRAIALDQLDKKSTAMMVFIHELPEQGFELCKDIPVLCEADEDNNWLAQFERANIGMPGNSVSDACEALAYDIVYAFDSFTSDEQTLGNPLKEQLEVLREYIRKADH